MKQFERIQKEMQEARSGKELLRLVNKIEADAILYCDEHNRDELYSRGGVIMITTNGKLKYLESDVQPELFPKDGNYRPDVDDLKQCLNCEVEFNLGEVGYFGDERNS